MATPSALKRCLHGTLAKPEDSAEEGAERGGHLLLHPDLTKNVTEERCCPCTSVSPQTHALTA